MRAFNYIPFMTQEKIKLCEIKASTDFDSILVNEQTVEAELPLLHQGSRF